jgi:hypothetical protein
VLFRFVRLAFAAAIAVTLGFTWTVGQGGLKQTNSNLCELWSSLNLPAYPTCEFQFVLPIVWALAFLVACVWMAVELFRVIPIIWRFFRKRKSPLGPPIKVEIPDRSRDEVASKAADVFAGEMQVVWKTQAQPLYKYDSRIHIVNVSRSDRLSLKLASYNVEMPNGALALTIQGIQLAGLTLNLGPQEETEGMFSVNLSAPYHSEGEHTLIIVDRLSEGVARVRVPGRYPKTKLTRSV